MISNKDSSDRCQSNNELNKLDESILLQKTEVSNKFINYITNTIDNTINSMDDSNTDRRKVTISEPSDKLSQDIQLKAEQILTDLRSLPLNYPIKRKRKPNMKNLSSTALNKNKHEDDEIGDLDDNDVNALLSDGGDDDSNDEYKVSCQNFTIYYDV